MAALVEVREMARLAEQGLGIQQVPQERTAGWYYLGSVIQLPYEHLELVLCHGAFGCPVLHGVLQPS